MRAQPGAQQRPKAFHRIDVNLMKSISILITGIFPSRMIDAFVLIAPFWQAIVDVVLICVNHTSGGNGFRDDGLDRLLLNIGEHFDENFAIALDETQYRRLFFG
jgi:hypothetical protein